MSTSTDTTKPEKRRRQNREFRIMCRPLSMAFAPPVVKPIQPRKKLSRMLGLSSPSTSLVDDFCVRLAEKAAHWALVVLEPSDPLVSTKARISITPDDSRIQRVYEICKPMKSNRGKDSKDDKGGEDEKELLMGNHHTQGTGSEEPNTTAKGKFKSMLWCPTKVAKDPSPPTLDDTSEDDRYEDDDGFPKSNSAGRHMNMQVSDKLKPDFAELEHNHLGSTLWEILTGIQARTKFTNSELKHEATRIWKRQQNYTFSDNNCQQFCILLAITIRAKNHSLLRVLHGETVGRQTKSMKFDKFGNKI